MRGGEKVLEALCEIYPEADIFTLIHIKGTVSKTIEKHKIFTSFMQKLPFVEKKYRYYLFLMPYAVERFNLKGYDLVISSSHCVAKGVKPEKNTIHICYCYTPMRYIWDLFNDYFGPGKTAFPVRVVMTLARPFLQRWDVNSSKRVDYFIAISKYIADRIKRTYGRASEVIYPPVDTIKYKLEIRKSASAEKEAKFEKEEDSKPEKKEKTTNEKFYLMVSAFAPYKRIDIAVSAFNRLGYTLKIIGSGQEEERLKKISKSNIEYLGWQSDEVIRQHYLECKALIFPGEEDFGIVPVEAMACGKPVIAFGQGGALETVIDGKTGVVFYPQSEEALVAAINKAKTMNFEEKIIREQAEKFSLDRFKKEMTEYINSKLK
ncbi:MAG: hypothetical protein A2231_04095 [Candidatus Firestonebacteria bacterium RIFOXYA2_FULL_40_8]|nr:MAG: hypothetical protein A2231_04095 [Candidatus Firestonebacteria bacterium RIFOXYA2_FULL_40_8]